MENGVYSSQHVLALPVLATTKHIHDVYRHTGKCTENQNCKTSEHFPYDKYPGYQPRGALRRPYDLITCSGKKLLMFKGTKKRTETGRDNVVLKKCQCECRKQRPEEFYDIFLASSVKRSAEYRSLRRKRKSADVESTKEDDGESDDEIDKHKTEDRNTKENYKDCVTNFYDSMSDDELNESIQMLSSTINTSAVLKPLKVLNSPCRQSVKDDIVEQNPEHFIALDNVWTARKTGLYSNYPKELYTMELGLVKEELEVEEERDVRCENYET